jgi:hypothetical protein
VTEWVRVYKFYPLESALRNLSEKRLKLSMIRDLNDPFEFLGYRFPNRRIRSAWENMRRSVWNDKGLICFSESWSNPVLWSHYADKHQGLALGFDIMKQYLHKINYIRDRPLFDIDNWTEVEKHKAIERSLGQKFLHWNYEQEQRIFVPLSECLYEEGLWFKPFDGELRLAEVVIGAKSETTSLAIRNAARNASLPTITARLAFQSFNVVKQLNSKRQK